MQWILENYLLLLIPFTSGIVGYVTNYLAVKMMFYPIEFIGIRPIFGWQGLIPMKRREMAEIEVELVLGKLLSVQELTERLDPQMLTASIERRLKQVLRKIVNQVMQESAPQLWASLPVQAKNLVYKRVEADIPNVVHKMVDDFKHNVDEIIDIKELVVGHLVNEPELINEIFLKAGEKEFPFIEKSGLYFGFLFGLPTMVFWYFYQAWWILPLGGLAVGYLTNWIAIKIIFEPKHPIKIFGFTIQGMFLKRQKEVSEVYSDIIERKLINAKNITDIVLNGSGSAQLLEIIELHVNDAIERYVAIAQPYFALGVGSEKYYRMKELAVQQIFDSSDKYLHYAHEYADGALRVGEDLCARMQLLSPEEFEGVLRPAYQADEWKLIVVGAILGMIAGFMQLYIV
ncbi:DUF445 domain-containing protein [Aliiglaciecola litoralis]|uniref:DUF445 family protein n=1 Tax=Aliiglaciecola litoralis TaxID=582857 RepID=A0ABN1LN08_9ALTE